jgi:hypothetical protein
MTDKQREITKIWLSPNGAALLDSECAGGYCSSKELIKAYPEETEFIKELIIKIV